jgi:hypothetical protein
MQGIIGNYIDAGVKEFGVADKRRGDSHLNLLLLAGFDFVVLKLHFHRLIRTRYTTDYQRALAKILNGKCAVYRSVSA